MHQRPDRCTASSMPEFWPFRPRSAAPSGRDIAEQVERRESGQDHAEQDFVPSRLAGPHSVEVRKDDPVHHDQGRYGEKDPDLNLFDAHGGSFVPGVGVARIFPCPI